MEHIVQFAIGIDDEAIKNRIQETAEKQVIEAITRDVAKAIFRTDYKGRIDTNTPQPWVRNKIDDFLMEHKDEIIKQAAKEFAAYLGRTKRGKEILARYEEGGE